MKRRLILFLLCAASAFGLCGCGSIYEKEYYDEQDYVISAPDNTGEGERITVRSFSQLRQVLLDLVSEGERESQIVFDTAYEGEVTEDMANACWQVRTQDALCAYCVENISYELSKIVTYYEANVSISYSDAVPAASGIQRLAYSTGMDELINEALQNGDSRIAILVSRSFTTPEEVEGMAAAAYRKMPSLAPRLPVIDVKMFSGNGMQRLYEINLNYGVSREELEKCREELATVRPFADTETEELDSARKALAACRYLTERVEYTEDSQKNSIYAALVEGEANSEGLAYAFVELCRQLGLEAQMIYGQRNWQDGCWNIVQLDGDWYHVDVSLCKTEGFWNGFLLRDEDIWSNYRWDVSAYPRCSGSLTYADLAEERET